MGAGEARVVVITGANEGIGHHMLRALLERGDRVAGLDVNTAALDALAETHPDQVSVHECDVTDDAAVEAAIAAVVERWGRIDVLVNNAAIFDFGLFADGDVETTRREFEVNYFGYVRCIRAVLPHMRAQGGGIVHNVSSGAGVAGHPGMSGYASTKGAIEALTRSIRPELARENIAVTVLHPSLARTRSAAALDYPEMAFDDPAAVGRRLAAKVGSRRRFLPADLKTRLGIPLSRAFPAIVDRGTQWVYEQADGE